MSTHSHLAPYPGSGTELWDRFPLGVGGQGQEVWDVNKNPHLAIVGSAGTGKTVALRTILFHALQRPERWQILGVCVGDPSLAQHRRSGSNVIGFARTLEDANTTIRFAKEEVERRYSQMAQKEVDRYTQLPECPEAILLIIDDASLVTMQTGDRADDKLIENINANLRFLLRTGRSAGVHLALAIQRPDHRGIFPEVATEDNLRYVTGHLDPVRSHVVLGSPAATEQAPLGRGILYSNGFKRDIQGYATPSTWFDQHVSENAAASH